MIEVVKGKTLKLVLTVNKQNNLPYFTFRCCPVYLSGSSVRAGIATSITQR